MNNKTYLKIGTDCSGIEAPIQALKNLNIPFIHEFSSEKDKYAYMSLEANYNPKIIYNDMTIDRKLPLIDIYICGFPCQPFSTAGKLLGSKDPRNLFPYCIKTIKTCKPKIFILENVKGLTYKDYFKEIKKTLFELSDYKVYYNIFNTRHYGIPQNRERLYIIGFLKKHIKKEFEVPKKTEMKDINEFIDQKNVGTKSIHKFYRKSVKKSQGTVIDLNYVNIVSSNSYINYCPTLMTGSYLWIPKLNRKATIKEYLKLQGFPENFKQVVSDSQLKKQIGNSMSVNVLEVIINECIKCINFSG